jgi:DNA-binding beta-propeller fold protein YncE
MKSGAPYFLLTVILCLSVTQAQEARPLVLSQTITVPGVQGGFNHMSADTRRQRLFAAASTNATLEILDLKADKPWRTLTGEKPAAARYAPEFDQLYVTRGQSVVIYDGETYAVQATIDLGSNLDELQYDAQTKRLYAGCMSDGKTGIAVISIPDGKLLGKIALPDKPQGFVVDHTGSRIFANMPDPRQVAVMDSGRLLLVRTLELGPGLANMPMGLDEAHHRLFVGTRHPAQVIVLDTHSWKTIATVDSSADADDMFYDAERGRIYVSCGEGFVVVIVQADADHYRLLARISTVAGARTSAFSAELGSLYVAGPRRGDQPVEVRIFNVGN